MKKKAVAAPEPVKQDPAPAPKAEAPKPTNPYAFVQEANRALAERGVETRYEVSREAHGYEFWKGHFVKHEKVDPEIITKVVKAL